MGKSGLKEEWPLQRLVHMLNQMQNKEKDDWKHSPLTYPNDEVNSSLALHNNCSSKEEK